MIGRKPAESAGFRFDFVVWGKKNLERHSRKTRLFCSGIGFGEGVCFSSRTKMKFLVLEPDGKPHEFVITRDKLGQEILDKVFICCTKEFLCS